jgi:hypothetical protein
MIEEIMTSSLELYTAQLSSPDATPTWTAVSATPKLVGGGGPLGATYVRMVDDDPNTAYLAGQCAGDCAYGSATGGYPFVMKLVRESFGNNNKRNSDDHSSSSNSTDNSDDNSNNNSNSNSSNSSNSTSHISTARNDTNGGWTAHHVFRGNNNTRTGWEGSWGDGPEGEGWSWGGGVLSFTVAAAAASPPVGRTPHRLAFTDDGFLHASFDGASTWEALYVQEAQRNPVGANAPVAQSWVGNGLMDQSSHYVAWANASLVFAAYTDIRGVVSKDGGNTWSFHYTGHNLNTMYRTETVSQEGSDATIYAATSSVHDMYQSTHLTDKSIDTGDGRVLATLDGGTTWVAVFDLKMPVVWVTKDAKKIGRLYAAGVHSTRGGIFVADGVDGVKPASFQRLTPPPRTQGHPYTVASLPDGALVVTYSGHTDDARRTFDNSSGVFYLPAVSSTRLNSTPAGCLPSLHRAF